MRIALRHESQGKRLIGNAHRQSRPCTGACRFPFQVFEFIGKIACRALKLIQHAARVEQNFLRRQIINHLIVVIDFVADLINFILKIIFVGDLCTDRRKNHGNAVFRLRFRQQRRVNENPATIICRRHARSAHRVVTRPGIRRVRLLGNQERDRNCHHRKIKIFIHSKPILFAGEIMPQPVSTRLSRTIAVIKWVKMTLFAPCRTCWNVFIM